MDMPILILLTTQILLPGFFLVWLWLRRADRRAWPFSVVAVVVGLG